VILSFSDILPDRELSRTFIGGEGLSHSLERAICLEADSNARVRREPFVETWLISRRGRQASALLSRLMPDGPDFAADHFGANSDRSVLLLNHGSFRDDIRSLRGHPDPKKLTGGGQLLNDSFKLDLQGFICGENLESHSDSQNKSEHGHFHIEESSIRRSPDAKIYPLPDLTEETYMRRFVFQRRHAQKSRIVLVMHDCRHERAFSL
jgi:hypothetical protein